MADEMVQKLPNDIILEMVTRLPLKHAIRFRVLNKYFYNNISLPKLLPTTNPPIIFHESQKGRNHRLTIISSPDRKSTTLPNQVSIIDSCNGFLLLSWKNKHYVFNPLTGGIKLLPCYINPWLCDGLAISEVPAKHSSSCFDLKLVELRIDRSYQLQPLLITRVWFLVHLPSQSNDNNNWMEIKSFYLDYHGSFRPRGFGAVYAAHGCVHWLGEDAAAIAAFDVETGRPMIMDGPLRNAPTKCFRSWFGLARGSLQFIEATMRNEIVVHSHNYATQEWCVAHKIPSFSTDYATPVFFDGQNVFFHIGKHIWEIYVYDLSIGEWNMSGQVDVDGYNACYKEFVPKTARVSDVYLWSSEKYLSSLEVSAELRSTLVGLQRLLLDHA